VVIGIRDRGKARRENITCPLSEVPPDRERDALDGCVESGNTAKPISFPLMMFIVLHVVTYVTKCLGHVLNRAMVKQAAAKVCKELGGEVHRNIGSCRM
jgi:hypothetical protein